MTVREILEMLYKDGWYEVPGRTKGSHIQLEHSTKPAKSLFRTILAISPPVHYAA